MTSKFFLASILFLSACGAPKATSPQTEFFSNLSEHCGESFAGKLVSNDDVDADFSGVPMTMTVKDCSDEEIRIPFVVGEDASRTWVISKTDTGLRLKHDHRHDDGTEDTVSQYGGDTNAPNTAQRQEFPVDPYSIELFKKEGLDASVVNIWAMEIEPDTLFAYEMARPNRLFRVEFDLSKPITP